MVDNRRLTTSKEQKQFCDFIENKTTVAMQKCLCSFGTWCSPYPYLQGYVTVSTEWFTFRANVFMLQVCTEPRTLFFHSSTMPRKMKKSYDRISDIEMFHPAG
jgi:hypothetical protein